MKIANRLDTFEYKMSLSYSKLDTISEYKDNWDGCGNKGYTKIAIKNAFNVLKEFEKFAVRNKFDFVPKVYPGHNGKIEVVFKSANDILVIISSNEKFYRVFSSNGIDIDRCYNLIAVFDVYWREKKSSQ